LLSSYRRSELQQAADLICSDTAGEIVFTAGLGLYHYRWSMRVKVALLNWLRASNATTISWNDVLSELREQYPNLSHCEDATIETLVGLWPEIRIKRDSIFDVTVELLATTPIETSSQAASAPSEPEPTSEVKRPVRERRSSTKKRVTTASEIVQGDLWG
jgi:hypothetical protein